jgi:hypothetical protein
MAYAAHRTDFAACAGGKHAGGSKPASGSKHAGRSPAAANGAGILRRLFEAIVESRQKRADREIAGFIARRGGRITDDLEREMTQRLLTSNWSARD